VFLCFVFDLVSCGRVAPVLLLTKSRLSCALCRSCCQPRSSSSLFDSRFYGPSRISASSFCRTQGLFPAGKFFLHYSPAALFSLLSPKLIPLCVRRFSSRFRFSLGVSEFLSLPELVTRSELLFSVAVSRAHSFLAQHQSGSIFLIAGICQRVFSWLDFSSTWCLRCTRWIIVGESWLYSLSR
jgi:hypothetical protein